MAVLLQKQNASTLPNRVTTWRLPTMAVLLQKQNVTRTRGATLRISSAGSIMEVESDEGVGLAHVAARSCRRLGFMYGLLRRTHSTLGREN